MTDTVNCWLTGLAAVLLSLIHAHAAQLKFLRRSPRSRSLSLLKEDLPQSGENRYWTFACGARCCSGLLLS